jgi:hypothetical protein
MLHYLFERKKFREVSENERKRKGIEEEEEEKVEEVRRVWVTVGRWL